MFQYLLPIFMIAASVGMYFGFIDPSYKETELLQEKKTELNSAINNANELTERRNELVTKINSFSADDKFRLDKLIPDHIDNVRLIMEIDRIALKYGMSLREVQVQGLNLDSGGGTLLPSGNIGDIPKDYDNVTLLFSVSSTYQTFKQFLKELEENLRITDIERVSFGVTQNTKLDNIHQFNVSLKTYWLK